MMIAYSRKQLEHGFSLMELLVALAIGAFLVGTLGNVLGGSMVMTRKALAENHEQEEVLVSTRIIASLMKGAIPSDPSDTNSDFSGAKSELSFTAMPPASMAPYGVLKVRLYVSTDASGKHSLLLDAMPATRARIDGRLELRGYRLFHDISSVNFEYLDGTDKSFRAHESWKGNSRLPALVSMVITRPGESVPISLAMAPRRTVNGRCRFDPVGSTCRY